MNNNIVSFQFENSAQHNETLPYRQANALFSIMSYTVKLTLMRTYWNSSQVPLARTSYHLYPQVELAIAVYLHTSSIREKYIIIFYPLLLPTAEMRSLQVQHITGLQLQKDARSLTKRYAESELSWQMCSMDRDPDIFRLPIRWPEFKFIKAISPDSVPTSPIWNRPYMT